MIRVIWRTLCVPQLVFFVLLVSITACEDSCGPGDITAPARVTDLAATVEEDTLIVLTWTAPGDEGGPTGVSAYDIRFSYFNITEESFSSDQSPGGGPSPGDPGSSERYIVPGLRPDREYYFALKATDESGNVSEMSNVAHLEIEVPNTGWWDGFGAAELDGDVHCFMSYNGDLLVGGQFTTAGGLAISRIAKWNGRNWSGVGEGFTGGPSTVMVRALEAYNGELVAAGGFNASGTISVKNIARWDGWTWLPLHLGLGNMAMSLASYNGDLYAGGLFYDAGGREVDKMARWDGSRWHSMGWSWQSATGVAALKVHDGTLYAGGMFTAAGGVLADNIASWDGSDWSPVGEGFTNLDDLSMVSELTVYNGDLIAAGSFTMSGEVAVNQIARWDGFSWSPLGGGVGDTEEDFIAAMTVYNGTLVVGGNFSTAGGVPATNIARWDGSAWSPLGDGIGGGEYVSVSALGVYDGSLYVGGRFTTAGGYPSRNIARWDD
jgi:hypothetical protein